LISLWRQQAAAAAALFFFSARLWRITVTLQSALRGRPTLCAHAASKDSEKFKFSLSRRARVLTFDAAPQRSGARTFRSRRRAPSAPEKDDIFWFSAHLTCARGESRLLLHCSQQKAKSKKRDNGKCARFFSLVRLLYRCNCNYCNRGRRHRAQFCNNTFHNFARKKKNWCAHGE